MSDYLWDKTGEADDETKRLEELLGGLKFQPRPLELPALPARPLRAARARALPSWPRLAVAASLAAALLVGAWLMLAERRTTKSDARQLAGATEATGGGQAKYQPDVPMKADDKTPQDGGEPQTINGPGKTTPADNAAVRPKPRRPDLADNAGRRQPRAGRAEVVARAQSRFDSRRLRELPLAPNRSTFNIYLGTNERLNLPQRESVTKKFTGEEIAAAEKVLFALRLTSEKLSYARQQVQDAGRREANR
jgi:hypothetical protein